MKFRLHIALSFFLIFDISTKYEMIAQNSVINVKRPDTKTLNKYYASNQLPLTPLSLIKLPVGSVKPQGWILKYLELQRDGLTGQLGEISAWLDKSNNAWFSTDGKANTVGKKYLIG